MVDETPRPEEESSGERTHSRRRRRARRGYQGPPAWADRKDAETGEGGRPAAAGPRDSAPREPQGDQEPEGRREPRRRRERERERGPRDPEPRRGAEGSGPAAESRPRREERPPRADDQPEAGPGSDQARTEGRAREEGGRGRRRRRRRRGERSGDRRGPEPGETTPPRETAGGADRPAEEPAPPQPESRTERPRSRGDEPRGDRGPRAERAGGERGRPDRERPRRRGRDRPEGTAGEAAGRGRPPRGDRQEPEGRRRRARERGGREGGREGGRPPRRGDDVRDRGRREHAGRRGERPGAGRNGDRRTIRPGLSGPVFADQPQKPTSVLMMPPKPIRVMIAGGGTGGHIIPALSIGEALKKRNPETELLFLGSDRGLEQETIARAGFRLEEFSGHGLPTRPNLSAVRSLWSMVGAYRRIRKLIAEFKPDVMVGTGGYVQVPGILAAKMAGVPIVLQEQNSVPGRANRFLSRFASEVHIHFTESRRYFKDRGKLRLSGNPVRIRIVEGRAIRTLQKFRLHADRRTVVILGGSQGAHSLNAAFRDMLPAFRNDTRVQFLIQTGKPDYQMVFDSVKDSGVRVVVKSYLHEIEEIYGIAHLVVARAGAMTLSELAACGIPSILVPYPHAMNDHQTLNARALSDKGAAVLVPDAELTGEVLAREIKGLLDDSRRLREMGRHAYALSRPDAARRIAESVERIGGGAPEGVLHLPEQYDLEDEEAIR